MSKSYSVHKISGPPNWDSVEKLTDFTYPWEGNAPAPLTFMAVHDGEAFHFKYQVVTDKVLLFHGPYGKMDVRYSDRVEIFWRKDEKMDQYFCFELDLEERIMDYETAYYRQMNREWQWPKGQLEISSKRTDAGYEVTGKVSLSSLRELGLLNGNKAEAGLFRAECIKLEGEAADFRWQSWVDPQTEEPDFHVPSAFGQLIFE